MNQRGAALGIVQLALGQLCRRDEHRCRRAAWTVDAHARGCAISGHRPPTLLDLAPGFGGALELGLHGGFAQAAEGELADVGNSHWRRFRDQKIAG